MRVLVTYGWCRTAYAAVENLAQAGFEVYGCDASMLSMARVSRFIRGFDHTPDPFQQPEQYVVALSKIIYNRHIDILLPMHEDAVAIQTYRHLLPANLVVACPTRDDLLRAMDKYQIIKIAESSGVPVPKTIAPTTAEEVTQRVTELGSPFIIKTRRGNSGKGVFLVKSLEEAVSRYRDIVQRFNLGPDQYPLLQEYIAGHQLYGSCFLAKEGHIKACFTERYLRCKEEGFGTSVLREPFDWDVVHEYTNKIVRALQWTGVGHFDFIFDAEHSRVCLLEMNPRFWGALNLAIQNGFNFPRGLITMLIAGDPDPVSFVPKSIPVKSLWIVGELIAGIAEFRQGTWHAPLASLRRIFFPGRHFTYDDFRWHDPLPLFIEMLYYARLFLKSGGDVNPIVVEMMR